MKIVLKSVQEESMDSTALNIVNVLMQILAVTMTENAVAMLDGQVHDVLEVGVTFLYSFTVFLSQLNFY